MKMIAEADHAPESIQTSATPPSTNCAKTSIFGKKSGFIIPKNKLSGSLVPLARGSKKGDAANASEEGGNQVLRKTKWGPDLLLDATVRKARVFAYQTRISQIEQQMTLGTMDIEGTQESLSTLGFRAVKKSDQHLGNEEMEQLEHERREILGEILKLNAAYKAPPDYKPLQKEAKVSIPIKNYPGYNLIALVFGPASATLKRLEKDSEAKIRVYGTKAGTGGKVEIAPGDGKAIENVYEDLYVHISADTYEKVDTAVALIELLVNPLLVGFKSKTEKLIDHISIPTVSHEAIPTVVSDVTSSSTVEPVLIQGTSQPFAKSFLSPLGNSPQYFQTWFSAGPQQTRAILPSGLVIPGYSSAQLAGGIAAAPSTANNPLNTPFAPRPVGATSFSPVLQSPFDFPSSAQLSHVSQPPNVQQQGPGKVIFPTFHTGNLQLASGSAANDRPGISSSSVPQSAYQLAYSDNIALTASRVAGQQPRGAISPWFPPLRPPSIGPGQPTTSRVQMHSPSASALPRSVPFHIQHRTALAIPGAGVHHSFSENAPTFDSMRPISLSNSRSQQPTPAADFTFQPQRPPNAASQMSWQSTEQAQQHVTPPVQVGQMPLQSPLLWHNLDNAMAHGFPRAPQLSHQMNQSRVQIPPTFGGNPFVPPRQAIEHHMQPRNFIPMGSSSGPFHLGPSPPLSYRTPQPLAGRPSPNTPVYDPFSPTLGSFNPNMNGSKATKSDSENDPEYEDLMASVGVK